MDRPQWTQGQSPEPQSWFDGPPAPTGGATRWNPDQDIPVPAQWRPVSELTDTSWGAGAAWHDPQAQWNVAAGPADAPRDADLWTTDNDAPWGGTAGDTPGWSAAGSDAAGWNAAGGDTPGWNGGAADWNGAGAPTDSAWTSSVDEPGAVAVLEKPVRKHAVRHPLRLGLFALVLFGLVAGSVAWMSMDKSVQLRIDGEARSIKTYASTVGGVLDDQKITVGAHDTLAPSRDAKISDGSEIVLRRGRLVTLSVDGKPRQVWTTATTVQEALEQVGYRQNGLWVSANRSTRLPLEGYQLTLRTPKTLTIVADGKKHTITTTVPTVGEAMERAGVTVDGDDRVSQLSGATVRAGMTITVTRVLTKSSTTETVIEYKTVERTDPKAAAGSRTVKTKGVEGTQQVTRVETYVNGKLTSSKIAKVTVLKKPVDEVVVLGPALPEEAAPPPSQPAGCADFPTTGGLNWCGLAKCESGLNPSAYNPAGPYYGLYQFDQQTWTANGGAGSPSGKSIAEQTAVAYSLYQARGASPWPVCGRNL